MSKHLHRQPPLLQSTFAVGKRHQVTLTIQRAGAAPVLDWTPPKPERLNRRERTELSRALKHATVKLSIQPKDTK